MDIFSLYLYSLYTIRTSEIFNLKNQSSYESGRGKSRCGTHFTLLMEVQGGPQTVNVAQIYQQ